MKRIFFAFFLTLATLLGGCVSQPVSERNKLMMLKQYGDVNVILVLGSNALPVMGYESFVALQGSGWQQVTHDTDPSIVANMICRFDASLERIAVDCGKDTSRGSMMLSSGSASIRPARMAHDVLTLVNVEISKALSIYPRY